MEASTRQIRPFEEALEDVTPFESGHPLDAGVTQAYDAVADEASNPASNLTADDEATVADQRAFRTPGMSLGQGCWRTVPVYSE